MFICQIPDHEHDQTQTQPRKQIRREDTEEVANSRPDPPPKLEKDRSPDRGGYQYARYEYPIGNVQYSRKCRYHDPHPRDVAADDDRPRSPSLEPLLGSVELPFRKTDISAVTSDEWAAVAPREGEVAGASEHRPGDHRQVGKWIGDRAYRRQVAAIGDRSVARCRQRHPQLLQEDHHEQAARLVMEDEKPDRVGERPQPGWFLQPPGKRAR